MNPLYNPILPPKNGYVEDVDNEGNHYYRKLPDPVGDQLKSLESENDLLKQQIKAASDQNDFLEDCIAEMAGIVYA